MKQGFTLVELLVVVLIIGILSAVAIPQYQAAVEKAYSAEALSTGKALLDAMNRAYAERPYEMPSTRESLDIRLGGACWTASDTLKTKEFTYTLNNDGTLSIVRQLPGGGYTLTLYSDAGPSGREGARTCFATGDAGKKMCRVLVSSGFQNLSL